MTGYGAEAWQAFRVLVGAGIVIAAYRFSRKAGDQQGRSIALRNGLLWCLGIAAFAAIALGHPSCEGQGDPIYGGCEQTADDGFSPTTDQRLAAFLYWAIILGVPMILGVVTARQSDQHPWRRPTDPAPPSSS